MPFPPTRTGVASWPRDFFRSSHMAYERMCSGALIVSDGVVLHSYGKSNLHEKAGLG